MSNRLKVAVFLPLAIVVSGFFTFLNSPGVGAADMSKFDPSNIMDDTVMGNKNTMSEAQIQSFLKSKNPCNDTNLGKVTNYNEPGYGVGPSWWSGEYLYHTYLKSGKTFNWHVQNGHFVCMADDSFSGESAAHIIWQAAQDYTINPQVLIVLLEKEQGLVKDTWPNNNVQYRSATGYGCPDTAACDTQYYGFKNQVRNAANFFRAHLDNNPCWNKPHIPGVQKAYWRPNDNCNGSISSNSGVKFHPSDSCGATAVDIKNRTTSALYSYTPYQPNQAALNAWPDGSSDPCSSYGNRNFWGFFTDWFGSTTAYFVPLDSPRWMQLKNTTQKIHYPTNETIGPELEAGRQVFFADKIFLNGEWYARTIWDKTNNNLDVIPISDIEEIPITQITPKWVSVPSPTNKVDALREKTYESIGSMTATTVVDSITVNGVSYYRTAYERSQNATRFIAINATENFKFYDFIDPRLMVTNKSAQKIDVQTGQVIQTIPSGTYMFFNKRITINSILYAQMQDDNGTNYAIKSTDLDEVTNINFIPLDSPRWMQLTSNTYKTHLLDESVVQPELSMSQQTIFVDKVLMGGTWYLRTKWDKDNDHLDGIALSKLGDILPESIPAKWVSTHSPTKKYDPIIMKSYEAIESMVAMRVVDKLTVDGKLYYRTQFEHDGGTTRVIPASSVEDFKFYDFIDPRLMVTNKSAQKIDVQTGQVIQTIPSGTYMFFNKRITINSILYAQMQDDNGTNYAIKSTDLDED